LSVDENVPPNERVLGHISFLKILEGVYISGTVKDRNFVYDTYVDKNMY